METQDAFTRGQNLIETIIQNMPNISKWQLDFMKGIFLQNLAMHGRFNFLQMSREGFLHEQTYRNNFEKDFDYLSFNTALVEKETSGELIVAFDPSFISKSGNKTPELGMFYSGCASRCKKGLEICGLAAIDLQQHTAYHLEAVQTPAERDKMSLVDYYAQVILDRAPRIEELSKTLVVDGYFAKYNFVNPICEQSSLSIVCRLRDDANLKYLYHGVQSGRGRPRKHNGKIDLSKIDKRVLKKEYVDETMTIFSAVVYSVSLKRNIRLAYTEITNSSGKVKTTKLFFSTDLSMSGIEIVNYYKARFQIEYLYRDAKQFTGLEHGQSRNLTKMYNHFNVSLSAVSIGKVLLRQNVPKDQRISLSISDICTELQNRKMIYRVFSKYGLDDTLIKVYPIYAQLLNYGKIAA